MAEVVPDLQLTTVWHILHSAYEFEMIRWKQRCGSGAFSPPGYRIRDPDKG
jgi:hypothetical protein